MMLLNLYVILSTRNKIKTAEEAARYKNIDCVLILGAAIWPGNVPCPILEDRLLTGVELYHRNPDLKLLMSGGCKDPCHDEPAVMRQFAIDHQVPENHILTDPLGSTTYDSLVRTDSVFCGRKIIIVTQKYHIYRALYMARQLGIDAIGVTADKRRYRKRMYRELREFAARIKYAAMGLGLRIRDSR